MSAFLFSLFKNIFLPIRNKQKHLAIATILVLVLSQFAVSEHVNPVHAADSISLDFHAFDGNYPDVQDSGNAAPGVRIRHNDIFGYFAEVKNLSASNALGTPALEMDFPALSNITITSGLGATYSDLICKYVVQTTGFQYNWQVDYNGSGSNCTFSGIAGSNAVVSGPASIPVGQSAYFRITGFKTKTSYAMDPFPLIAKNYATGTFAQAGTSSGAPINTFVTVGDTTINGKTFFDNGSLSGEPDNGTKEADESYVSTPALFTMYITDGSRSYSGTVDGSGNYSIVVPENNEIGATLYYMGAPITPAGFRVTTTLPSGILAVAGITITNPDIGFNNQTDLSLAIISDAVDPVIGSTINYTVTLTNNGPTTATNILVDLPIASQSSYSTSVPGAGTHISYEGAITTLHWTTNTLAASTSATLTVTVNIITAGLLTQHAEIISQDTPVSTYGSPDEDSTPGNHIGSEDDYAFTSFSVTTQPQISGFTFTDTRGDHSYGGSEDPALAGVLIRLHDTTAGSDVGSTTTDASGNFSFTGLTIGHTYQTIATTPGGYNLTTSNDTQTFTSVLGNGTYTADAMGYFQPGSISGMVFIDLNSNANRDVAENTGPSGVTVNLINGSGSTISSTTTDGTGNYSFSGLAGDNYSVHFVPPTNYGFVIEHAGASNTNSDVNPLTGSTETIAVLSGSGVTNIDAGIYLLGADLSITKSASQTNPFVGQDITYYINVHNDGPLASSGSTVSDILPSEVSYVSYTASGGTYDSHSGIWTLPTIPSGENVQLNITVTVMAPTTFRNTTNIATEVQLDNNLSNNTSFVDVTATKSDTPTPSPNPSTSPSPSNSPSPTPSTSPSPSNSPSSTPSTSPSPSPIATPTLTIEKYVLVSGSNPAGISTANQNGPEVSVGSPILYYLDINNTSDVTANNIEINDSFPTTLNSAGWTCNGELNSASGGDTDLTFSRTCTVSNNGMIPDVPTSIPPHSTLHIRLSGKTVPQISGELCNSAGVKADYVNKISDAACITVVAPHITLIKSASPTQIIPGGTTTYSLTVTNTGNIAAHNVEIIDDLSNSELGSDLIPRCVLSSRQITVLDGGTMSTDTTNMAHWTIGTLAPGHSETVHLQAEIRNDLDSSVHCLNVAIAAGTSISSSQANATVSVPVTTPSGAQLTFLKEALNAVNNHVFNPGDHVQYRLSINNTGNQNSELLSIDDAGNAPILKVNSAQSTGGIVSSINPLHVGSLLVSGSRNQIVNYDSSIIDADHFPLRTYHVHKTASKTDADFYPERVQKAKLRSNDSSNSTDALGNPDGRGVSLGTRGSIVLATTKTNKMIVDGDGDDFCIATLNVQSNTRYRVSVSQSADDDTFEELATSNGKNNCFDLSDSDLSWARYIKIEDRSLATSFNEDTSINIDAVCLLHLGGLVDNTATLSTASQQIGSSTSTIVVDFTDAFDTPLSSQDCKTPKQARIIEPAPLPPLPIPVPTPVYTPSVETPVELPKTGSAPWMPLLLIGSLTAIRLYFLGRKQLKK